MALLEKHLSVKESTIPDAGMGLYTSVAIPKGTQIVEYKGKITTWKEVQHNEGTNGYIFFVNRNHVIDARRTKSALARYANDARGLKRVKGLLNNCVYETVKGKVYIKSVKDIPAGAEILVDYGKDYWDAVRHNIQLDKLQAREAAKKAKAAEKAKTAKKIKKAKKAAKK